MKLHLVRHGSTKWNAERRCQGHSESELDQTGIEQANALRPLINSLSIDVMYVSSSIRTRQTAELIAKDLDVPVTYLDELREIQMGPWEQRLWSEIEQAEPDKVEQFRNEPHLFELDGGETFQQVQQRGVSCIEQIIANSGWSNILVVSHGKLLKTVLHYYRGVPLSRFPESDELANCSHCILEAHNYSDDGSDDFRERRVLQVGGTAI